MITAESLQDAFRYLFPGEVACLKRLAQSLPPNPVVVNIGAGAGTSGLAFMESRADLTLITVDIESSDSPFGSLYSEADAIRRAGLLDRARYIPIQGDSKKVAELWGNGTTYWYSDKPAHAYDLLDMVFVDADHEYFACKGDILGWLPHIKPGGIIAVHDYKKGEVYQRDNLPPHIPHPLPWRGVDRAVRKFLLHQYPVVEHVDTLIAFRV